MITIARPSDLPLAPPCNQHLLFQPTQSSIQPVKTGYAVFRPKSKNSNLSAKAVHVVAPDRVPMEKILGSEVATFVRGLHESHGVVFHLGETVRHVDGDKVTLTGGQTI